MAALPPLRPDVGFCFQTETKGSPPRRWYVNMCSHRAVEMPVAYSGVPVSREHILKHGLSCLQIPFDMGTFRKLKERAEGAKRTTFCIDAVFHPFIIQLFMEDAFCNTMEKFRPYVIGLVLKRIEDSVGVKLPQQNVKLVKSQRYKDWEEEGVPREFAELPGAKDCFDDELPEALRPPSSQEEKADDGPLIQDMSEKKKPALKKGFLNKGNTDLYGPNGSGEGVLPENAGDPMGYLPKKLRQSCKIIDTASPEYQEQEKQRRNAEERNGQKQEFHDMLTKDLGKWAKKSNDLWQADLPEGTEQPAPCKYDVDYSRFDKLDDVEDAQENAVETRDWYYDEHGQRQSISKKAAPSAPAPDADTQLKKGFLDSAKKALYPKGSEQKAPLNEEQLMKEFMKEPELMKELGGLFGETGAAEPGKPREREALSKPAVAKVPDSRAPAFTLSEVSDGLQLVVSVPALGSMEGVELDVTERRASLAFPAGTDLKPLQVELPSSVVPNAVRAKFSRKTHQITVSLPVMLPAKAG